MAYGLSSCYIKILAKAPKYGLGRKHSLDLWLGRQFPSEHTSSKSLSFGRIWYKWISGNFSYSNCHQNSNFDPNCINRQCLHQRILHHSQDFGQSLVSNFSPKKIIPKRKSQKEFLKMIWAPFGLKPTSLEIKILKNIFDLGNCHICTVNIWRVDIWVFSRCSTTSRRRKLRWFWWWFHCNRLIVRVGHTHRC